MVQKGPQFFSATRRETQNSFSRTATRPRSSHERHVTKRVYSSSVIGGDLYSPEKWLTVPMRTCRSRAAETSLKRRQTTAPDKSHHFCAGAS